MTRSSPMRIYQENLDAVSEALMAGDLCKMLEHLVLPHMMATNDTELVISSPEELDMVMTDFRTQLLDRRVSCYARTCIEADYVAGQTDMIAGRHRTETRNPEGVAAEPYTSHMVLMEIEGCWKAMWIQSVMANTKLQILSPDIAAAQAEARRMIDTLRR